MRCQQYSTDLDQAASAYAPAAGLLSSLFAAVTAARPELVQLIPHELLHLLSCQHERIIRGVSSIVPASIKLPRRFSCSRFALNP